MSVAEKIVILAVFGLVIAIPVVGANLELRKDDERDARYRRICADFKKNEQAWIAEGTPGGYEAMRDMLQVDNACRPYAPKTVQQ